MPNLLDNYVTEADLLRCTTGPNWAFELAKDDDHYLEDQNYNFRPLVTAGISVDIDTEAITVEFMDKRVLTLPAGSLTPQAIYPMNIVRLLETGTGASIKVTGWMGKIENFRLAGP